MQLQNHPPSERVKLNKQFRADFDKMVEHRAAGETDFVCKFGCFVELER